MAGDSTTQTSTTTRWVHPVVLLLCSGIFVFDVMMPSGYGEWVLYLIPMLLTAWIRNPKSPLFLAAGCTVLVVLGFCLELPGITPHVMNINRVIGGVVLWVAAALLMLRKQAETSLQESEDRYHSLVSNSMDAVLLSTPDGRVLAANKAACLMFGRSEEELIQVGRGGVVDTSDPRLAAALAKRAHTGGFVGELTFVRKDGTRFTGELSSAVFTNQREELRTSMVIRDVTRRKQAEAELHAGREQLGLLTQRLVALQETSQRELARELHDRVGQSLTALNLNLSIMKAALPPESERDVGTRVEDSLRLVADTMGHVRDVMAELHPPELDDYGLAAALRLFGERFGERAGLCVHVRAPETFPRFPTMVETALFRIAQEAMNNIAKHAGAKEVTVTLECDADGLRLIVADDGVGFDPSAPRLRGGTESLGLATMHERIRAIGGRLGIDSAPGKGTKVIAELAHKE